MPSLVRFLTTLFWLFCVGGAGLYILATVFEPVPHEYRHEVLGLTIEE